MYSRDLKPLTVKQLLNFLKDYKPDDEIVVCSGLKGKIISERLTSLCSYGGLPQLNSTSFTNIVPEIFFKRKDALFEVIPEIESSIDPNYINEKREKEENGRQNKKIKTRNRAL